MISHVLDCRRRNCEMLSQTQEEVLLEKILGPDDAVDGLRRCVSDGTARECFLSRLRLALVAFSQTLQSQGASIRNVASAFLYRCAKKKICVKHLKRLFTWTVYIASLRIECIFSICTEHFYFICIQLILNAPNYPYFFIFKVLL